MDKLWSVKRILLSVLVGVVGWLVWSVLGRSEVEKQVTHSSINTLQPYRCAACKAEFQMDWAERRKLANAGKVVAVAGEPARMPCPACGKVEATLKLEVPPDEESGNR